MLIPREIEKEFIYSLIFDDHKRFEEIISRNEINYKRVLSIISFNRIEYFVINKLNSSFKTYVLPQNFFKELEKKYLTKSITTLKNMEKIFLLSKKLTESDIEHIFLKGISLYDQKRMCIRPMRDIDILVNPEDILSVVKLAKGLEFKFINKETDISETYLNNSSFYDLPLMVDHNEVFLEIHYRITTNNKNCFLKDNLFESKRIIKIHENDLCLPSFNSLFMHLVYHGSKKGNFNVGLSVLTDLLLLFEKVDKDEVLKISEPLKLKKISELFFELIEFSKNKNLILSKNSEKLKEILIFPPLNSIITEIFMQESLWKMFVKLNGVFFVSQTHLYRQFGLKKNFLERFYLFRRWISQIKRLFLTIFFVLRNLNPIIQRSKIIKNIYNK